MTEIDELVFTDDPYRPCVFHCVDEKIPQNRAVVVGNDFGGVVLTKDNARKLCRWLIDHGYGEQA